MTPSEATKAVQAKVCSELLHPMSASCWIVTHHYHYHSDYDYCYKDDPSESAKALQATECSELLDPMNASC